MSPFGAVTAVVDTTPAAPVQPPFPEPPQAIEQAVEGEAPVELPLQELLQSYSVEQLGFDSSKVPTHVTTTLPLATIKPQLSSGKISLPLSTVVEGCDERFHRAFAQADQSLEIRVPIQQVFRYLPAGCMAPGSSPQAEATPAEPPASVPFAPSTGANPFAPAGDQPQQFETPFSAKASEDEQFGLSAPPVEPAAPAVPPFEVATVPNLLASSEPPAETPGSATTPPLPAEESTTPPAEATSPHAASPFGVPVARPEEPASPQPPTGALGSSLQYPGEGVAELPAQETPPTFREFDLSALDATPTSPPDEPLEPPKAQAHSSLPGLPQFPSTPEELATGGTPSNGSTDANPWAAAPSLEAAATGEPTENPWAPPAVPEPASATTDTASSGTENTDADTSDETTEPLAPEAILPADPPPATTATQLSGFASLKPLTPLPQTGSDLGLTVPTEGVAGPSSDGEDLTSDDLLEDLEDLPAFGVETATVEEEEQEVEEDFTFGFQDDDPTLMTLRAVFETDEQINLEKAVELSGLLPGIAAAVFLDGNNAVTSRNLDVSDEPFANRAPEVYESVRGLATAMGIGEDASTFTIRTNSGLMSFFKEGKACLGVLHQNNGFLPGIREKLTLVTKGLAGMALPS